MRLPSKVQAITLLGSKHVASSKKISACSQFSNKTARTPHSNKLGRDPLAQLAVWSQVMLQFICSYSLFSISLLPVNMTLVQGKGFPETLLCFRDVFSEKAKGTIIQPVIQVLGLTDQPLGTQSIRRNRVIATLCPTFCVYYKVNAP